VKVRYDRRSDILTVILKEGVAVGESDEGRPGVILDYDHAGNHLRPKRNAPLLDQKTPAEESAGVS
jgi:uncharacterized protein DUF2283